MILQRRFQNLGFFSNMTLEKPAVDGYGNRRDPYPRLK